MEVALIAPSGLQHWHEKNRYEMLIPVALKAEIEYQKFYSSIKHKQGKHITLDNGAFESEPLSDSKLLTVARQYKVDEVVAPDVIADLYASINKLEKFLTLLEHEDPHPNVMAAIQGMSLYECKVFIDYVARMQHVGVWSLGFPRHLTKTTGRDYARLHLVRWVHREYPGLFRLHALGYNWPGETQGLSELEVRSMDTDVPLVAAYYGVRLDEVPERPERPKGYWSLDPDKFDVDLVKTNIDLLTRWAHYQ